MQSTHELLGKLYQQLDHYVDLAQQLQNELSQLKAERDQEKQTESSEDE